MDLVVVVVVEIVVEADDGCGGCVFGGFVFGSSDNV